MAKEGYVYEKKNIIRDNEKADKTWLLNNKNGKGCIMDVLNQKPEGILVN